MVVWNRWEQWRDNRQTASGNKLEAKPLELADGLEMKGEGKRRIKGDSPRFASRGSTLELEEGK